MIYIVEVIVPADMYLYVYLYTQTSFQIIVLNCRFIYLLNFTCIYAGHWSSIIFAHQYIDCLFVNEQMEISGLYCAASCCHSDPHCNSPDPSTNQSCPFQVSLSKNVVGHYIKLISALAVTFFSQRQLMIHCIYSLKSCQQSQIMRERKTNFFSNTVNFFLLHGHNIKHCFHIHVELLKV